MRYNVIYEGADSRATPGKAVNSMWVVAEGYELYAEVDPFEFSETTAERMLIGEIVKQAIILGIDPNDLDFNLER